MEMYYKLQFTPWNFPWLTKDIRNKLIRKSKVKFFLMQGWDEHTREFLSTRAPAALSLLDFW